MGDGPGSGQNLFLYASLGVRVPRSCGGRPRSVESLASIADPKPGIQPILGKAIRRLSWVGDQLDTACAKSAPAQPPKPE